MTDMIARLGKPRHLDIDGDRAYVVVPTSLTYKIKGKAGKQTGSMLTIALQKGAGGWKMTGWTWTRGK
jgi:ketosteroid isomerase-like protein